MIFIVNTNAAGKDQASDRIESGCVERKMSEDEKRLTFGELLEWHIKHNTRPAPVAREKRWSYTNFAEAVGTDERNARMWRRSGTLPNAYYLERIERTFFGDNPEHDEHRRVLRMAYDLPIELRRRSEKLIDTLGVEKNIVERIVRREALYEEVWKRLSSGSELLVLFGGVASALCDDDAAARYAHWLTETPSAKLFVCYESGAAAVARATRLDPASLPDEATLSRNAELRMLEKEKRVLGLRDKLTALVTPHDTTRVVFVPLLHPLTAYVMIADDEVYLTPILEARSSDTLSFALANDQPDFRRSVYKNLIFHLNNLERCSICTPLIEALNSKLNEDLA